MSAGERTRAQPPSSSRLASTGSWPRSIRSRTSRGSAASTPTAKTTRLRTLEGREELLGIYPPAFGCRASAGSQDGERLQIVATARVRLFAVRQSIPQLAQQQRVFGGRPRAAPDDPRQPSRLAQKQPAVVHVQGRALPD